MALTDEETLRLYLGERVKPGMTADDTFFSDDEIQLLFDSAEYTDGDARMYSAAVLGWMAKAGEYARLIDMNESGGQRMMSQKYRQAASQVNLYQARLDGAITLATASGRVVGRSIDWAGMHHGTPRLLQNIRYAGLRTPGGLSC